MPDALPALREALEAATGRKLAAAPAGPLHDGGHARWASESGALFVKTAAPNALDAFEAEAAGLAELAAVAVLRVPAVLATGSTDRQAFIALECIELTANTRQSEEQLGAALAMLHRSSAPRFGWYRDNTIGRTAQSNRMTHDWPGFFVGQRLVPQLALAERNGADTRLLAAGHRLCECVPLFFTSYQPVPSLVHGDLWGGNWGTDTTGQPVVFDPAVYYGDRETDLAMTRLFGGYGPAFYTAYQAAWPLDQAAGTRRTLYNLYHVLNHYNLFGSGYGAEAQAMTLRLLAEIGR